MKLTKEVIDEYTAFKTRLNQNFTEAEEARYILLTNEFLMPAYKDDPTLAAKVDKIIELKRSMSHLVALHDSLRAHIIKELETTEWGK